MGVKGGCKDTPEEYDDVLLEPGTQLSCDVGTRIDFLKALCCSGAPSEVLGW